MTIRSGAFEVRLAAVGGSRPTTPFNREYGGLTNVSFTGGVGSHEEPGGDTLAQELVSDQFDVRSGTLNFLDTSANEAIIVAACGRMCATGRRAHAWFAEAGDGTGQTPRAREYGPVEVVFSNATLTVGTGAGDAGGGAWALPFDVHGDVPAPTQF